MPKTRTATRAAPRRAAGAAALAAVLLLPAAAGATSGFGCYRANVPPSDALAVRAGPSASAAVVARLDWAGGPIVALRAPGLRGGEGHQPGLFEVHRAEGEVCVPGDRPRGARWCPVAIFSGGDTVEGWIKRRFVDHSECP